MVGACASCHGFGGKEWLAHNQVFEKRPDLGQTSCLACHTEHRGRNAPVTKISEAQCQSCHTVKVQDFARSHPPFPANFPYDHPQAIRFDHISHLNKHFADQRLAALVPQGGCIGCHQVENAGRVIKPAGFETACAGCHADAIAKRDFVLFRWPEIEKSDVKPDDIVQACGLTGESLAEVRAAIAAARRGDRPAPEKAAGAFSAVSVEQPTMLSAYLLGTSADDAADYSAPMEGLILDMMRDGTDPLVAAVQKRLGTAKPEGMLAGLNAEQARQAACAWAANREYEPPGTAALPGWRADALDIRYAKPQHASPVIRAWIEAVNMPMPESAEDRERLTAARKELLSASDGPGQCAKCHTMSSQANGAQTANWMAQLGRERPHTRFDHRAHLDLLGPEKTCTSCHTLGQGGAAGAFQPIALNTCSTCHAAGRVRDDCQLCHVYHQDHALMKRMMSDAK